MISCEVMKVITISDKHITADDRAILAKYLECPLADGSLKIQCEDDQAYNLLCMLEMLGLIRVVPHRDTNA